MSNSGVGGYPSESLDGAAMPEIAVTLSGVQVREVVQRATALAALGEALMNVEARALSSVLVPLLDDRSCSRSLLRGLIVLAGFPLDGAERELTSVASEVGLSPATTHRYLYTWTAAGVLSRDANSRRYRRIKQSD